MNTSSHEKLFLDTFNSLAIHRNRWQVWEDFVIATACTISNSIEKCEKLEEEYKRCVSHYDNIESFAIMFACIVNALEENPEQDFLGKLFMQLELGNHWRGQFFTPYDVCVLMSELSCDAIETKVENKGWAAANDSACGAGATLIALANTLRKRGVNYQNHILFVAQDVDRVAGLMCYIQLSLLGCAGYVVIANTLTNPVSGSTLIPEEKEDQEFWYTPMYYHWVWKYRRLFNMVA